MALLLLFAGVGIFSAKPKPIPGPYEVIYYYFFDEGKAKKTIFSHIVAIEILAQYWIGCFLLFILALVHKVTETTIEIPAMDSSDRRVWILWPKGNSNETFPLVSYGKKYCPLYLYIYIYIYIYIIQRGRVWCGVRSSVVVYPFKHNPHMRQFVHLNTTLTPCHIILQNLLAHGYDGGGEKLFIGIDVQWMVSNNTVFINGK